ncbi:hypothetical protein ACFCYH_18540 [Streptomyces sp. NPDC056400]
MPHGPTPDPKPGSGLLLASKRINAARTRAEHEGDGGGTGRSDGND